MSIDLGRRRDLGALVRATFSLYRRNLGIFLPIALVVVVPVDLLVLGVGLGRLWGHYDAHRAGGGGVGGLLQFLVLTPLVTAAHIAAVVALSRGERPSPWWSVRQGLDRFAPVLGASLLAVLTVLAGLFLLIVPGVYLAVALFFSAQAVVAEDRAPLAALRRSRELVRGQWWRVFGIGLVFSALIGIPTELVVAGAQAAAKAADAAAIELAGTIVANVFGIAFTALGGTLVYFDLRARHDGPPPPAPRWAPEGWEAPSATPRSPGPGRTS